MKFYNLGCTISGAHMIECFSKQNVMSKESSPGSSWYVFYKWGDHVYEKAISYLTCIFRLKIVLLKRLSLSFQLQEDLIIRFDSKNYEWKENTWGNSLYVSLCCVTVCFVIAEVWLLLRIQEILSSNLKLTPSRVTKSDTAVFQWLTSAMRVWLQS